MAECRGAVGNRRDSSHGGASNELASFSRRGASVPAPGRHRRVGAVGALWRRRSGHRAHALPTENARQIGARPIEEVGEGRAGVVWYGATLLAVFFALHTDIQSRLARRRAARSGAVARRRMVASHHGAHVAHRARSLSAATSPSARSSATSSADTRRRRRLACRAARRERRQLLNAGCNRRRTARSARRRRCSPRSVCSSRTRGGAAFLRDTPWRGRIAPIVAGLGLLAFTGTRREHRSRRALVRLHRGARFGGRDRAVRTDRRGSRAARAAALRRGCGGLAGGSLGCGLRAAG